MSEFLLSVDVEDWFHAHNLGPAVSRDEWDECEFRVERNTRRILDLFDEHDTKATFFVLGWVAERLPELVREIDRRGHEIASHGYNHRLLSEMSADEIRADVGRSLEILEDLTDQPIRGYRAPSFSITDTAVDVLADLDFEYDSSSFPVSNHDRYGSLSSKSDDAFVELEAGVVEAQLPRLEAFGTGLPWAGGGYFRFIPYPVYRRGVKRIASSRDFIFYFHPWELDPDQPKFAELPLTNRVRHYTNLEETTDRLARLLSDFDWQPIGGAI
ncbi:XrtA system polysaccharide deacetylase [Halorussus ruber]|uniref:XrtA system polysaccharide deacetylase n=1 Tax=Halorussus ruber TaxID=1126238 RepID=UPI0010922560|nr:XrtA system polysaccharide deacetylase [Halorussus ruber]